MYKEPSAAPLGPPSEVPNPSKGRTAWMMGTIQNDMAYYKATAGHVGPAGYNQDTAPIKSRAPRPIQGKEKRFYSSNYESGPGPNQYLPPVTQADLIDDKPPKYTFGSKGVSNRSAFIYQEVLP
jgi:hypothetical protein